MKKTLIFFSLQGLIFLVFEYTMRCLGCDTNYFHPALLLMWFIGGLCTFLIGLLNSNDWVNSHINMFWQSILSCGIITGIELLSGILCNLILHLDIWSYTGLPLNLLGQISLPTSIAWFLLSPFAMWVDDVLYWYIYILNGTIGYIRFLKQEPPARLIDYYKHSWNPFAKPWVY